MDEKMLDISKEKLKELTPEQLVDIMMEMQGLLENIEGEIEKYKDLLKVEED